MQLFVNGNCGLKLFCEKKKTKQKRTRQTLIPQLKVKLKTEIKFSNFEFFLTLTEK